MNFLFLGIFSRFFKIKFAILMLKLNKKMQKGFINSRGTHMDATWHARPRGSAMRRLRGDVTDARYLYLILYSL